LQAWLHGKLRDDMEYDGFALPSGTDFPGPCHGAKVTANLALAFVDGQADEETSMMWWSQATQFFNRYARESTPLILSSELSSRRNLSVPLL